MENLSKHLLSVLIVFLALCLTSCASTPLQAPCDANATFCGTKTKINSW
ncbi:MAG: hypothetical protein WAW84_06280 [Candidatus Rickettsiella isopodorum]|nr:hypothetical protein [Gammaproteobacteria bacterium]